LSDKSKKQRYYTRRETCQYPRVTKPDTKFNAAGVYSIALVVEPAKADAIIAAIQADVDAQVAVLRKDKKFAKYPVVFPVKDQEDKDTGEATGRRIVTFKQTAKVVREGQEDLVFSVKLVDAKGRPITGEALENLKLGSGSEVDVCYNVRVVPNNLQKNFSVKLQPIAVQILKLVEFGGEDFQFESDEKGFEAEEGFGTTDAPAAPATTTGGKANGDF
jgi:hypothetical protein